MPEPLDPQDEHQLVRRVLDDPDAFQALYALYFKRIYSYVASRIDVQQDIEDVVSEIFFNAVRRIAQLRNQYNATFAAWIFTIARNAIADYYRQQGRAETIDLPDDHPAYHDESQPDAALIQAERAAQLRSLLRLLPPRRQEIITLRYFSSLRNQEIAAILEIDERTVAAHLSRGLRDLYEKFNVLESDLREEKP